MRQGIPNDDGISGIGKHLDNLHLFEALQERTERVEKLVDRPALTVRPEGLDGIEFDYTLETFQSVGFRWQKEGLELMDAIISRQIRTGWAWSANPGNGKTGLAIVALKFWAKVRASPCGIVRFSELSSMEFNQRKALTESYKRYKFVVLDDVHRLRFELPHNLDWFHGYMDVLYRSNTSILVTANVSYQGVRRLTDGITKDYAASWDRLLQGGFEEVQALGESRRA